MIAGAKITEYLLEKSRIVTHAADERNYHVFYEMLKGLRPEEKERYGLTAADNYFYLNQVTYLYAYIFNNSFIRNRRYNAALLCIEIPAVDRDFVCRD